MRPDKIQRLKELLLEFSYQKKTVRLASGRMSDFYFDGKQTSLHPEGVNLIGEWMLEKILESFPEAQAVGGPTLGADPIASAVSLLSEQRARGVRIGVASGVRERQWGAAEIYPSPTNPALPLTSDQRESLALFGQ